MNPTATATKTVTVIGSTGLIGSQLVQHLTRRDPIPHAIVSRVGQLWQIDVVVLIGGVVQRIVAGTVA